jgi:hypothetical protein
LKKSGKLQQSLWRAPRIDTEGQALDLFLSGHPEWNREPSLLELDFDMLPAVESMRAKDRQLLEMQRMKRVKHRNFTRIAGIIAAGWSARPTSFYATDECSNRDGDALRGVSDRIVTNHPRSPAFSQKPGFFSVRDS